MNEIRFKAVYSGLSSVAKNVYDHFPSDVYWSIKRMHAELFSLGKRMDTKTLSGVMNTLVSVGLFSEVDGGVFSKNKITKPQVNKNARQIEYAEIKPVLKKETPVPEKAKEDDTQTAFDSLRETVIKFLDVAKQVNALANEVDAKLAEVEKRISDNNEQMAKFKQLTHLLKTF